MPGIKGKDKFPKRVPEMMGSFDFRAEKARKGLEYKDFSISDLTLCKILSGDPSVTFIALIVAAAELGFEPYIVLKPIQKS